MAEILKLLYRFSRKFVEAFMLPEDEIQLLWCCPVIARVLPVSQITGCIVMEFSRDVLKRYHDPQRMNPTDLSSHMTFDLVPPAGQSSPLSSETNI